MSESLKSTFGDCQPDPASDIATQIMMLKWARGASLNDHCHRYGEIQELADPIIKAAIAAAHAKGRAEGIGEAVKVCEAAEARSCKADYPYDSGAGSSGYEMACGDIFLALRALLPTTGGSEADAKR